MWRYVLRRLLQVIPLVWLVSTLVFSLVHLIPGDPVEMMLGDGAERSELENLRSELGLDRPIWEQYGTFLSGLVKADLGSSFHFSEPVATLIARHYPATLELAFASMLVALAISLPFGILSAFFRDGAVDHSSRFFSLLGVSIPNFWLGPMLILFFAIGLDLFPVSGRGSLLHLVLPAITLGTALAGLLTRMVRSSLTEELHRGYLVTARAKGRGHLSSVVRHALKNASIPIVTVIGLQFGALLTGAIITETIFSWPGLGRLIIQAIRLRDYPLVQGGILVVALTYLTLNLLTDLIYAWLDPRIRYT